MRCVNQQQPLRYRETALPIKKRLVALTVSLSNGHFFVAPCLQLALTQEGAGIFFVALQRSKRSKSQFMPLLTARSTLVLKS
jgi:hypothetical protein